VATGINHYGLNPFRNGDRVAPTIQGLDFKVFDQLERTWAGITRQQHKDSGAIGNYPRQLTGKHAPIV